MATSLHRQLTAVDQAGFLVDYLRSIGVTLVVTWPDHEYVLSVSTGPAVELSGEILCQIRALKPEIMIVLMDEKTRA